MFNVSWRRYLAALAANMSNFSVSTSGTVSGGLLAFFGLSATLFSQIKTHLFSGNDEVIDPTSTLKGTKATQSFLLFLTFITTAVYLIAAAFMVKIKKPTVKNTDSSSSSNVTIHDDDANEKVVSPSPAPATDASRPTQALSRTTTFTSSMNNGREPASRLEEWNHSNTTLDKESMAPRTTPHLPGDNILEETTPVTAAAGPITTTNASKVWFNPYLTSIDMKPKALLFESTFWFFVIAQVSQQGFSYINNVDSIVHAILDPTDPSTV